MAVQNVFTVDVEDWFMTSDFAIPPRLWGAYEDRIERNTERVLDLVDEFNVKGTFFVLGSVAKKHPRLVRDIVARGHEIASHGGWHQMLHTMSLAEIQADLRYAKAALEDAGGQPVRAFRAPSWSLSPARYTVLEMLEAEGFTCDSSLQPFRTPLSGIRNAPEEPFYPVVDGKPLSILEFPSTVVRWAGTRLPFAGGLYLRTLPISLIRRALRRVNCTRPGMVYIHPWELDVEQPRIATSMLTKFTHYHQLDSTVPKVRQLLKEFSFRPLRDVIAHGSYPRVNLSSDGAMALRDVEGTA